MKKILPLFLALVLCLGLIPAPALAAQAKGEDIVSCAMQYLGKVPYVSGGTKIDGNNPGADCSGFICRLYEKFGFNFWGHRTSVQSNGVYQGTDLNLARPGDIIHFKGHVAIFAGWENGNPMIVHETGGDFQNVVYTKMSVVRAEFKGIYRIPGVYTDSSGPIAPEVVFSLPTEQAYSSKQFVTETNAMVVNHVSKPSGVKVTQMGVYLYDAGGNQLTRYAENVSNVKNSTTSYHSWFDINQELGVTLTPGTQYSYRFFGIFDGGEEIGPEFSFTTSGAAPISTPEPSPGPEISLTLTQTPGSDGAVELNAADTALNCLVHAPAGTRIDTWRLMVSYTDRAAVINIPDPTGKACVTTADPAQLGMSNMTKALVNKYGLKAGDVYEYWFTVEIGGTAYESPKGRLRVKEEKAPVYSVSFSGAGDYAPILVTNGQPYGALPQPTAAGKSFEGWYTSPSGGSKVTEDTVANLTGSQTLYARWKEERAVTLVHSSNAGSGGVVDVSSANGTLTGVLSAPAGKKITRWTCSIYTTGGALAGTFEKTISRDTTGNDIELAVKMWPVDSSTLPVGTAVDYGDFTLTVGTVYTYELTAEVDGRSYTTGRAKFRLAGTAKNRFTDVSSSDWFAGSVAWAVEEGITAGTGDGTTFSPKKTCTQTEILTFLWNAAGKPSSSAKLPSTPKNAWAADALRWAFGNGMIDAFFEENAACTRSSAVWYIWKAFGSPSAPADGGFTDVPSSAFYANAVTWAVNKNVTTGTGGGKFSPNMNCDRSQIVSLLQRAYGG